MKNLKKVLAMVLAFACTFSMFAGAKVFEDVPAGSDYSEAITMLSDLGIIQGKDDGKYHPEDTITRAEACAMIARLMTGDPNVSQYVWRSVFHRRCKGLLEGFRYRLLLHQRHRNRRWQQQVRAGPCNHRC